MIVQVKAFLNPMPGAGEVQKELVKFFHRNRYNS